MAGIVSKAPIQSTAGAIPMKNDKGEVYMQKVKVSRYVPGKRPDYAPQESSDEDEDMEVEFGRKKAPQVALPVEETETTQVEDRRLRRLQERPREEESDRLARHRRHVAEPEVLGKSDDEQMEEEEEELEVRRRVEASSDEEEGEELDEEEIERRRKLLRERAQQLQKQEEVMDLEEEKSEGESEEESEYEEYSDSEEEETGPRLKPVFVRKKDRITIQERERNERKERELEVEAKKLAEERKLQARRMVEDVARKEFEDEKVVADACDLINTDDENDEEEYEAWKLRELKRLKRDREEREQIEKERQDVERLRTLTEEERRADLKANPKVITNKASKGKYKFLQKYYHRGAFFMDEEEDVFKRDHTNPTLEDHFDKTILPKVMQVKNFGRSGRTKYTHLVDQDTTSFDSPWAGDTVQNIKTNSYRAGMKQVFVRPSNKRQ